MATRAVYRGAAVQAQAGDFVRGWADAGATEEVAGVVLAVHPDALHGSNLVLACLDLDELAHGDEPDPEELPPGALLFKDHSGRPCVATLRTIEAHSDRFELVHRRADLPGHRGVLREPDPQTVRARQIERESRQRQMEGTSFVPPKDRPAGRSPVVSSPPPPLEQPRDQPKDEPHPPAKKDESPKPQQKK